MKAQRTPAILLVDDERRSLEAMEMALEDDFEIFTAISAEEALRVLEDEWIQVVFCDQRMPGMTGVELLTRMRDQWPETVRRRSLRSPTSSLSRATASAREHCSSR